MIRQPYLHRLLLALLLSTALFSYGQEAIIGNVQDEIGNPIAYANVLLLKTGDSTLVKGTITEENGSFVLTDIPKGHYLVSVSLLGFKPTATDPFDLGGSSGIKLPPIILFEGVELDHTQSFTMAKNLTSELNLNYSSPSIMSFTGTAILEEFYALNVGIQKKFGESGGTLAFKVNDLMDSIKWTVTTDIPQQNLNTVNSFDFSNRTFLLTYSNNFGNRKLKSARERGTGAEEEKNRVQ